MDKWVEIGKAEGLEGTELREFIRERDSAAREERVQLLELKKNEITILELKTKLADSRKDEEPRPVSTPSQPKIPKLPVFQEESDDLDSYLLRFEKYAQVIGWPRDTWALNLSALLSGKALQVYTRLSVRESQDYEKVREALCKRFNLTEEGFRKKFRNARPEKDENAQEFITRLQNLFDRWLELAKVDQDLDKLKALMIQEQFMNKCSSDLFIFLKERGVTTLEDMGLQTEHYVEARRSSFSNFCQPERKASNPPVRPSASQPIKSNPALRPPAGPASRFRPPRNCYICRKPGHFASECQRRSTPIRASCLQETEGAPMNAPMKNLRIN